MALSNAHFAIGTTSRAASAAPWREPAVLGCVLHSRPMPANRFFFAYFWFSPLTGGWRSKRA
jgi:hypothetical protein